MNKYKYNNEKESSIHSPLKNRIRNVGRKRDIESHCGESPVHPVPWNVPCHI